MLSWDLIGQESDFADSSSFPNDGASNRHVSIPTAAFRRRHERDLVAAHVEPCRRNTTPPPPLPSTGVFPPSNPP